jgi:hypothetical protein
MNTTRNAARNLRHSLGSIRREFLRARRESSARSRARNTKSSVTDRVSYVDFCALAAADDHVFESFRREPVYVNMLEHVTEDQGAD